MGQVILKAEDTSARLTFLAPTENINRLTPPLLDHLTAQAGEWGAFHLLAEVDENSPVFRSLRQAGFAMYAWQRIWKLPQTGRAQWDRHVARGPGDRLASRPSRCTDRSSRPCSNRWKFAETGCGPGVPPGGEPAGLRNQSTRDQRGSGCQPLVPPDSGCGPDRLAGLAGLGNRPVYVCVRSYQAWLETVLDDLGATAGPRQAVMVRRLAKLQKVEEKVSALEKVLVKPVAPVARMVNGEEPHLPGNTKINEP